MAAKTANIMARVAPDVKLQAEEIMEQLGIPVSVVINALYKQIIMTKSIPFSLSIPKEPAALEDMTVEEFYSMMLKGCEQAEAGDVRPVKEVFAEILKEL